MVLISPTIDIGRAPPEKAGGMTTWHASEGSGVKNLGPGRLFSSQSTAKEMNGKLHSFSFHLWPSEDWNLPTDFGKKTVKEVI